MTIGNKYAFCASDSSHYSCSWRIFNGRFAPRRSNGTKLRILVYTKNGKGYVHDNIAAIRW